MKALCPKPGKGGKIHPSPPEDPIAAAFRLLPAAILVLVAGLCPEDQRVLAHLVARSFLVDGPSGAAAAAAAPEQARRLRREHPPTVGCVCFECYSSFWSRWDSSPQQDRIHDAMAAFEEHLAAAESSSSSSAAAAAAATPPSSSKRRDKGKRSSKAAASPATPHPPPAPPAPPARRPRSPEPQQPPAEVVQEVPSPLPLSHPPPPPTPAPAASTSEDKENVPAPSAAAEPAECGGEVAASAVAAEEERKRGWADVMGGVLNPRRWGIWSPALESAT